MFIQRILRMAGIADDQGELQPHRTPLSFAFSVARRDPPVRDWRPPTFARADAMAKEEPLSGPH